MLVADGNIEAETIVTGRKRHAWAAAFSDKDIEMYRWDTIKDFYADRGGEFSGEQDMGVWHWDDVQIFDYPRRISADRQPVTVEVADESYLAFTATGTDRVRVSVVAETGDVYALRFKTGEVALLGNIGLTDPERGLSNSRERSPAYIQADVLIGGYTQESGPLGCPLSWFIERLDAD